MPKELFETEFATEVVPIVIECLIENLPHLSLLFHKHIHIGVHTFCILFHIVSVIWSPNLLIAFSVVIHASP